jgi:hypothetical protein
MKRTIRVYIHKRSSLDFSGDDRILVAALCALEDQVYDFLDEWPPITVAGLPMTQEPLHPTRFQCRSPHPSTGR